MSSNFHGYIATGTENTFFRNNTHTVPLGCFLPYELARKIVQHAAFTIDEINGYEVLKGGTPWARDRDPDVSLYITQKRIDTIKGVVYAQKEIVKATLASSTRSTQENYEVPDNEEVQTATDAYLDIITKAKLEVQLFKLFNADCKYYAKHELLAPDDDSQDIDFSTKGLEYVRLRLQGKTFRVTKKKEELHPLALLKMCSCFFGNIYYAKPKIGGVDDHFYVLAKQFGKTILALENSKERDGKGEIQDISREIDKACESIYVINCFISSIARLKASSQTLTAAPGIFESDAPSLHEDYLPDQFPQSLLERNDLWVARLLGLGHTAFKRAFAYVGKGHLRDLFAKLKAAGCTVSERIPLGEVMDVYLEEETSGAAAGFFSCAGAGSGSGSSGR